MKKEKKYFLISKWNLWNIPDFIDQKDIIDSSRPCKSLKEFLDKCAINWYDNIDEATYFLLDLDSFDDIDMDKIRQVNDIKPTYYFHTSNLEDDDENYSPESDTIYFVYGPPEPPKRKR